MKRVTVVAMVVGVVVIVGLLAAILFDGTAPSPANVGSAMPGVVATDTGGMSATHAPVPADVTVPDKDAQNVPANVAVPQTEVPAAPGATANLRVFTMTETAAAFTPNTVVVKSGDTVDISITASGGNYDFVQPDYGLSLAIPNGATKKLEFQALTTGKFTFYCASCGGPSEGPVGYVIVTE